MTKKKQNFSENGLLIRGPVKIEFYAASVLLTQIFPYSLPTFGKGIILLSSFCLDFLSASEFGNNRGRVQAYYILETDQV